MMRIQREQWINEKQKITFFDILWTKQAQKTNKKKKLTQTINNDDDGNFNFHAILFKHKGNILWRENIQIIFCY